MKVPSGVLKIYVNAVKLARDNNQTIGPKNDYFVTLEQLEALMQEINYDQDDETDTRKIKKAT